MGRGGWMALVGVGTAGAVGLGVWTWFLAGRSLDVMDQWSSVVSSFVALVSLMVTVVALIVGGRASRADEAGSASATSHRLFRARDASGARVTLGDHSPISDQGDR